MTGEQVRAARAALRMDQSQFAKMCGLSVETIKRYERIDGPIRANIDTIQKIYIAIEDAGITFIEDDTEYGPGSGVFISAKKPEQIHLAILNAMDHYKLVVLFELNQRIPDLFEKPLSEILKIYLDEMASSSWILEREVKRKLEADDAVRTKLKYTTPDGMT